MSNKWKAFLSLLALVGSIFLVRHLDADLKACDEHTGTKYYDTDGSMQYGKLDEVRTVEWTDYSPECRENDFLIFDDPKENFNRVAPLGHIDYTDHADAFNAFRNAPTAEDGYNSALQVLNAK